jgi:hypothetical protein
MGLVKHTVYNAVHEEVCPADNGSGWIETLNMNSCVYSPASMYTKFMKQAHDGGHGLSLLYNWVVPTWKCPDELLDPAYFRTDPSGLTSAYGLPLNDLTVAAYETSTVLTKNDRILILDNPLAAGTIKTVTDKCGGHCLADKDTHVDNFSTRIACDFRDVGGTRSFRTIRLR